MKANMLKLLIALMLLSLNVFANENSVIFFEEFIDKESQGHRLQRLDNVVIDAKEYACNSDEGNLVSDEFDMDVNSLYLISDYHFTNKNYDDNNAFFDVNFSVVGELYYPCGTKVIDGEARLFKANKAAMNVRYQLKKVEKSWVVVNPPKPFVTCSAYGEFLDDVIARLKTTLAKKKRELPRIDALLARFEAERLFLDGVCFNKS